jgi:hypothetical protein
VLFLVASTAFATVTAAAAATAIDVLTLVLWLVNVCSSLLVVLYTSMLVSLQGFVNA